MQLREAVLATADLIEKEPHRYRFIVGDVPDLNHLHRTACVIAFIHAFMGTLPVGESITYGETDGVRNCAITTKTLGVSETHFYDRLEVIYDMIPDKVNAAWFSNQVHGLMPAMLREYVKVHIDAPAPVVPSC